MSNLDTYQTRSWLFTPATRSDRFAKAAENGADVAIIDLEDSVSQADKEQARQKAISYLSSRPATSLPLALRINGLDTRAGIEDIHALLECGSLPDYLVLPKTESAAHLQILDRLMMFAGSDTRLIGIIESVRGLNAVESIAAATPKLAGLIFGAADMAADIGAASTWEPLALARARLVSACAMNGIPAIDAPFLMSTMFQAYSLRPFAHLISAFLQKRPFIPHKSAQSIPYLPPLQQRYAMPAQCSPRIPKGSGPSTE